MDDLVKWLRAQIAEDEEAARKRMHHAQENHLLLQDPKYLGRLIPGWHEWPEIEAAAAHVLAVCEAHTAILQRHQQIIDRGHDSAWPAPGHCVECWVHEAEDYQSFPCNTLRALALAYQHRPGYREEWRP